MKCLFLRRNVYHVSSGFENNIYLSVYDRSVASLPVNSWLLKLQLPARVGNTMNSPLYALHGLI